MIYYIASRDHNILVYLVNMSDRKEILEKDFLTIVYTSVTFNIADSKIFFSNKCYSTEDLVKLVKSWNIW